MWQIKIGFICDLNISEKICDKAICDFFVVAKRELFTEH